ncbi:MAG: peptide-methionine (R)-S-oxide reductase MsrB [Cohaesibacteraceae bacterium]|nr:peptide-methionine (R)-S-oxide reductase MsrB [Cohaesibacteraceae bacterium]MBL4876417.1 peptide-methionine (R)-S-oxide reductase MsrB [Cohaesibacteraceae bacterium]
MKKTDAQWRETLTTDQYNVTRNHATERAGSSCLNNEKRNGVYRCVSCDALLYKSEAKYDSGSGWPSFFAPSSNDAVTKHSDTKLASVRTEIRCSNCDAHLGHVFDDGPAPTGLRYCMNGIAMNFLPDADG